MLRMPPLKSCQDCEAGLFRTFPEAPRTQGLALAARLSVCGRGTGGGGLGEGIGGGGWCLMGRGVSWAVESGVGLELCSQGV